MNYERLLIVIELGADPGPLFAAIRRLAPSAAQVTVFVHERVQSWAWLMPRASLHDDYSRDRVFNELREAAQRLAPSVDVVLTSELTCDALAAAGSARAADLIVAGPLPIPSLALLAAVRRRIRVPILFLRSTIEGDSRSADIRLLCLAVSTRARRAVAQFLHDHATAAEHAVLLSSARFTSKDLATLREVWGIAQGLQLSDGSSLPLSQLLGSSGPLRPDLIVLPRLPPLLLLAMRSGPSVLVIAPIMREAHEWERSIDAPDALDDGERIRVKLEYAVGVGRRSPIADQVVTIVREGKVLARSNSRAGELELPSGLGNSLGVIRGEANEAGGAALRIEARIGVLRPNPKPIVLFDADMPEAELAHLHSITWADPVGVRVRPLRSCASLRAALRSVGLDPWVLDASAVLDEGEAADVPEQADGVRLARVASRMRLKGFGIVAIVHRGPHAPAANGFAAIGARELPTLPRTVPLAHRPGSLIEQLNATMGNEPIAGNSIQVELDNRLARTWLLSAIGASRSSVHFQVYMAADDDVGRAVEAALAGAAARGVAVRVLVDSLHGLHGSLGTRNPLLERLASRPGITLRVSKPITHMPSLEDVKQRDHRKLALIDGEIALLGGRNLSHEYYTGFDEVQLTAEVPWRTVPWLEAGARVRGPAVEALELLFLQAWTEAGGDPFDIRVPEPAGQTTTHVIGHRGLHDAYTLESYLALIETARSHVYVVNGFPLLLEIQHALLRALGRGVRVRALVGNLTPRSREGPFKGPWAQARTTATSFVHSRMDPVVAAGGECYELVIPHLPVWDLVLGDVRPHVHAKMMSVDGSVCALGSANLDVTASYWENEVMLVIEDAAISSALEARLDELLRASDRFNLSDPAWRRRAEQRRWMRYWPGNISI